MDYKLYKMHRLDAVSKLQTIEGFIYFHSNEDRSTNVAELYCDHGKLPSRVLAIGMVEDGFVPKLDNYVGTIEYTKCTTGSLTDSVIPCLRRIDSYVRDKTNIGVDISAMPVPIFIQILHFLFETHANIKILVCYTEPKLYNLDNLFDFKSFQGEIELRAIPGFEGKSSQEDQIKRIVFYILGFEKNYINSLIPRDMKSDGIIPINGFPSYFPKYKDISTVNNNVNYHELDIKMVFSEANNPFEVYNQLCDLKRRYEEYCIDIVSAGTKPMALGACLFALKNSEYGVRILFPFPNEYISKNSVGNGPIWGYTFE